jgi:hypothetical protein
MIPPSGFAVNAALLRKHHCSPTTENHLMIMRQIVDEIEDGILGDELRRRGLRGGRPRVRLIVETCDDDDPHDRIFRDAGGVFDWQAGEKGPPPD